MKAQVEIYADPYFIDPPLRKFGIDALRLQSVERSQGMQGYVIGDRLLDSSGRNATDFEHDNVWSFRMEVLAATLKLVTAEWYEITGVVSEIAYWIDENPWEGAEACKTCEDAQAHVIVEHYTPPKRTDFLNKWVRVRCYEPQGEI